MALEKVLAGIVILASVSLFYPLAISELGNRCYNQGIELLNYQTLELESPGNSISTDIFLERLAEEYNSCMDLLHKLDIFD